MPDLPISGLPGTTSATVNDLLPIVNGGVTKSISTGNVSRQILDPTAKVANYTLTTSDRFITVDASGANRTVFVPAASGNEGIVWTVKKIDSSANTVTIDPSGSETIDGAADYVLTEENQAISFTSNGTNIVILFNKQEGSAGTGDVVGPASSTDNAITRYDGTTGKVIQNSNATVDDTGAVFSTGLGIGTASLSARAHIHSDATNKVCTNIRGFTGQTAALSQWRDAAGTVIAQIAANGAITGQNLSGTNTGDITVTDSVEIDFTLTGQNLTADIIVDSIEQSKLEPGIRDLLTDASTAVQPDDLTSADIVTPAGADYIFISDTSDSGNIKRSLVSALPGGGGGGSQEVYIQNAEPSVSGPTIWVQTGLGRGGDKFMLWALDV